MKHTETVADSHNSKDEADVGLGLGVIVPTLPNLPYPHNWTYTTDFEVMTIATFLERPTVNDQQPFGTAQYLESHCFLSRGDAEQSALSRINGQITYMSETLKKFRATKTKLIAQARLTKKLAERKK